MRNIPNAFQKGTLWTAISALSIAVIAALVVGLIYLLTRIIAFLQPILIPFAVAGVMAYLLEPIVVRLMRFGLSRQKSIWLVFGSVSAIIVGVLFIVVPAFATESRQFAREVPGYVEKVRTQLGVHAGVWNKKLLDDFGVDLLRWNTKPNGAPDAPAQSTPPPAPAPLSPPPVTQAPATGLEIRGDIDPSTTSVARDTETLSDSPPVIGLAGDEDIFTLQDLLSGEWLRNALPRIGQQLWEFVRTSVGGFLGVFGFMLSLIIVPLYLYYFLTESPKIAQSWHDYVPLRASKFKNEVVDTLTEINSYLIAFFRGQLVVSLINGVATGLGLTIVGVKFGWLIGLALCILGIIPYLGIIVCWIPAVIIASVQGGSWMVSADSPWWVFPAVVTAIFAVVQQIDGFFITPKIVGESVGLHPMTVIVSVFAWSLVMGGLLGAILAVPMTAALKVLFHRYVWQRRMAVQSEIITEPELLGR